MDIAWELSQSFVSDGQGIRTACVLPNNDKDGADMFRIVTGTQGGGLCEFGVPSGNMTLISYQHNHAITAMLSSYSDTDDGLSECYYVTGCKDHKIRIFGGNSHELIGTLEGHEKPVTSLSWCFDGNNPKKRFLISGSWDGTAKVWNFSDKAAAATLVATLPDHENSVCVCGLPKQSDNSTVGVATGSAGMAQNNTISGHTVRLWQINTTTGQTKLLHSVANDHDGPIRDIVSHSRDANILATCSNDGTVKLRLNGDGKCESTLTFLNPQQQHPPMLLSLSQVNNGAFLVASSDDGQVIIWNLAVQQSNPHVIPHSQCVWRTLALPNGDIGTCCQDGTLRIFTCSTERYAAKEERDQFTKQVAEALRKTSSGPSSDEISKLPKWEFSATKQGTSEGQVQLFQKEGKAIAAQWSMASQTWIEVGEVMGTKDTGMIDGVKYDHVLPIEVDQPEASGGGIAKLQIGYNNGENPFVAAQRFIDTYMLPQYHLQQIADYIQQRVGAQTPTIDLGSAPGSTPTTATSGIPIVTYEYIPSKGYKVFELTKKVASGPTFDKMKLKIQEFGGEKKLSMEQFQNLSTLMETLAGIDSYGSSKIQDSELNVIEYMLQQFPLQESFPAVDIARYTLMHPNAIVDETGSPSSLSRIEYWSRILHKAVDSIQKCIAAGENSDKATAINIPMLCFRFFTNAVKIIPTTTATTLDPILSLVESYLQSKNKNIRLAVATLLHNISFLLYSNNTYAATSYTHIVTILNTAIRTRNFYEAEAMMRIILALGTIVTCGGNGQAAKETAQSLYLATQVQVAASSYSDPAIKAAAKEVYTVLS